jgi:YVTN family beta-propeller protein
MNRDLIALATVAGAILLGSAGTLAATPTQATAPAGIRCDGGATEATSPPALATPPLSSPAPSGSAAFRLVTDIPIPGSASRFDYQSFDETMGRLYIAHMGADQVVVFDTSTQQIIATVGDVQTPTGVLAVPELGRVFVAAAGSHDVAVIDAERLDVIAHTGQIGFPDGLDYAPTVKQVFVSDESGGGELVIDATTNKVVTTIDIGGEAGNTHYDPGSGCILVAVQSQNQLAVIDPTTDRLVGRYDLDADCQTPHGFLIDASRRRAFVTCEDNARLLVLDLQTMQVTATHPVGDGPDVLAFDPNWRRLYVASESGVVSVFDEEKQGLTPVGEYAAPHAHSVSVDPATHQIYLPLENVEGTPVLRILEPVPAA